MITKKIKVINIPSYAEHLGGIAIVPEDFENGLYLARVPRGYPNFKKVAQFICDAVNEKIDREKLKEGDPDGKPTPPPPQERSGGKA